MAAGRSAARAPVGSDECVLALDDALSRVTQIDSRKAKVVELRCFAGLSVEECDEALKVSEKTILRGWRLARVWLARELKNGAS